MICEIPFAKASGAGNDFVLINNRNGWLECDHAPLARALCARHTGIGADGLLILESSQLAEFRMLYYNSDGSSGGMCGNGGRCIARFAYMLGLAGPRMRFDALGHIYEAEIIGDRVRLKMKDPSDYRSRIPVQLGERRVQASFINTGAPHTVMFVDNLETLDIQTLGSALRYSEAFAPEGTNANFVHILDKSSIEIRTYERGVEAETLACGTGSIASAIVSSIEKGVKLPVHVHVRSGEKLLVTAVQADENIRDIHLEGSAYILFTGTILYNGMSGEIEGYDPDRLRQRPAP